MMENYTNGNDFPIDQPISLIEYGDGYIYRVGYGGVTRIEPCYKSGVYASVPYLRVWEGERCLAELCQHNVLVVTYGEKPS